eukprot:gb/GEZN01017090.1/.p2 GENE.gb/GEZN01017090.1/~~gb/GEZN01017090.1/.p2  ORF type:complete len:117 (-),score=3.60 gb/GEZN01017090.1/:463-789(-)
MGSRKMYTNVLGKTSLWGDYPAAMRTIPLRVTPKGFWNRKLQDMKIGQVFSPYRWKLTYLDLIHRHEAYWGTRPCMLIHQMGVVLGVSGLVVKYYNPIRHNRTNAEFH